MKKVVDWIESIEWYSQTNEATFRGIALYLQTKALDEDEILHVLQELYNAMRSEFGE